MTPGATGKGRLAVRAGLLLALLGLWVPEAGAQSIGEVVLSPERLQEGDVEQDGNPDPEQEIEVRFTLGSRPAPFTPAAIVANTIRVSESGRASEEDFEAHRLVRTPGVVFLLSERNCEAEGRGLGGGAVGVRQELSDPGDRRQPGRGGRAAAHRGGDHR